MKALKIIAGKTAQQVIRREGGMTPDMIRVVVGASGGPKWLILRGLDDFIFGDWLSRGLADDNPVDLIGTSIGSMRMALASTSDPRQAFTDFIEGYFDFRYQKGETIDQWTADMVDFFNHIFTPARKKSILENQQRRLNIIATRCHGIAGHPTSVQKNILGMVKAQAVNLVGRDRLAKNFDRVIFSVPDAALPDGDLLDFNCQRGLISPDNLVDVMMASGSIPGFWHGVKDIQGGPRGVYRDGGITDYHFGNGWPMPAGQEDKLVLYPHFYDYIVPGWFDKKLKSRRMSGPNWDNVVMVCPSRELVESLPAGRITDRKDFTAYSNEERLKVWTQVVDAGWRMADEFDQLVHHGSDLIDRMELPA